MARRVDVVRDYIIREFDIMMSEGEIITNFCPTAIQYDIHKLGIQQDKDECLNSNCKQCWDKEVTYKRVDPPLQEGDILKKIDGK